MTIEPHPSPELHMDERSIEAICRASVRKYYIPETDIDWAQPFDPEAFPLPELLISLYGLPIYDSLTQSQKVLLARHELASTYSFVMRLENVLMKNFTRLVQTGLPDDPLHMYYLHEIEEEARHNRMFIRLLERIGVGPYPMRGPLGWIEYHWGNALVRSHCMFLTLTLGTEVFPDHFHERCIDSDPCDPVLRDVSRLHRIEEARHIFFAKGLLRDTYARAPAWERGLMRWLSPLVVGIIFDNLVPPSVYLETGICSNRRSAWALWAKARTSEHRLAIRKTAAKPLLSLMDDIGVIDDASRGWWRANHLLMESPA